MEQQNAGFNLLVLIILAATGAGLGTLALSISSTFLALFVGIMAARIVKVSIWGS